MKQVTGKNKLIITSILIILFLLFYVFLLPHFDVSDLSRDIFPLDVRSSYSPEYVKWLLQTIGEDGIQQYKQFLILDIGYIFIYGILSYLTLDLILSKMGKLGTILHFTNLFPFILMFLDLLENANTFFFILNSKNFSDNIIRYCSAVTTIKWLMVSVVTGTIVCYIFYAVLRYILWKLKSYK